MLDDILNSKFSLDDCPRLGAFDWHNLPHTATARAPLSYTPATHRPAGLAKHIDVAEGAGALVVNNRNITGDPLESAARPNSSNCHLTAIAPVPRAIPKFPVKKGTTTLGFEFKGGIVIAVDSRATQGQYIASQTVQKVIEINNYLVGTMAGGAADCQYWERYLGMECRLWELRNGSRITVSAASKILSDITFSMRHMDLSMGTMVAGWDKHGPSLYYVDDSGTRMKHQLFSVGSGSIYAYGVLDTGYKYDMEVEEACDLARRSIFHATYRDGASGSWCSVYHIHANGWTKVSRDDVNVLYDRYVK